MEEARPVDIACEVSQIGPYDLTGYPDELMAGIFSYLPLADLVRVKRVCTWWNSVVETFLENTTPVLKEKYFAKWGEFIQFDPALGELNFSLRLTLQRRPPTGMQ